ncbi:hypothetical protein G7078_08260 [Sphingomonas sinipercae]|uniref:Uncharacterized protein n=1 Tax=Sphingomonas sinipercae TaxID=2714944 RepID=A0A6G7ZPE5_9SPHN|nr:hypothetical protein G7078_08260 [Sphingomonas sinipercae]
MHAACFGSTTNDRRPAQLNRGEWPGRGCVAGADGIQELAAGDEDDARAGNRQQPAAKSRIGLQVMMPALHRADRDGIDHHPRFGARLDREQSTDFLEHRHILTPERFDGGFEPKTS